MINAAEIAYSQGVDLYGQESERIVKGLELAASYLNGDGADPNGLCQGHALVLADGNTQPSPMPTWEIAYNHYAKRLGQSLPQVQKLVLKDRQSPPGTTNAMGQVVDRDVFLHITWETLTHGDVGNAGL